MASTAAKDKDFGRGKVSAHIISIAVPSFAAQLVQLLYSVVDRIYLGHYEESTQMSLTGLGLCFPLISFVLAMTALCAGGAAPLSSIERGRKDLVRGEQIIGNAFLLILASSLAVMLLYYLLLNPLLTLCGAGPASLPYARQYMLYYTAGTFFAMAGTGLLFCVNAQGFAREGMCFVLTACIVNIVLDPILIFYFDLGIKGAAIASVIAQLVMFLQVLHFLTRGRAILKLRRECCRFDKALCKAILSLGVAGFVMQGTNALVLITCNSTLRRFGGDAMIGIMTIVSSIRDLISLPLISLTRSAQPVISFNLGAGKLGRIMEAVKFMSVLGLGYMLLSWAVVVIFPRPLLALFNLPSDLMDEGIHAVHLYFFGFCFMALHSAGQSTFVGLNLPRPAIFFSLFRKAFIVVPLTLLLPWCWDLGSDGVFIAEPVSNVLSGVICFSCMWWTLRRLLREKTESPLVQ